jgi:hypothetical protein
MPLFRDGSRSVHTSFQGGGRFVNTPSSGTRMSMQGGRKQGGKDDDKEKEQQQEEEDEAEESKEEKDDGGEQSVDWKETV